MSTLIILKVLKVFYKLYSYLKEPTIAADYQRIKLKEFVLLLLLTFLVVVPFALLLEWAGVDQFDHILMEMLDTNKWLVLTFGVLIAPLIEEPIYRLHLDRQRSSIWWGLGLAVLTFSEFWFPTAILMIYLVYLLIRSRDADPPSQKFVVYTSAILFALVHMGNYIDFDFGKYFYWVPFLVIVQFWIGLVLSYIRSKYGMWTAIGFHAVYNAVFIIPMVYFYEK